MLHKCCGWLYQNAIKTLFILSYLIYLRKVTPLLSPNQALATPYAGSTAVAAPSPPRRSSSPTALDRVPIPGSNISRPINTAPPRTGDVSQNGADCPTEPLPDHAPINPEAMERQPEVSVAVGWWLPLWCQVATGGPNGFHMPLRNTQLFDTSCSHWGAAGVSTLALL